MNDQPPPDTEARARLAALVGERPWPDGKAGRLVERWLPGGTRGTTGMRALAGKHRFGTVVVLVVVVAAIVTAIVLSSGQPAPESAPTLPPAISAGPASTTQSAPTSLVVSVVGKVTRPGLVTLPGGARVADAIEAAGGLVPGTDDTALNLARRLSDGEQIYVGIPAPAAAATDAPTSEADPAPATGKGKKGANPDAKVNLNTATAEELQTLPGVGQATATRILNWRNQHGHFDSIGQLRQVGGIGQARYAKIQNLVTT